MNGWTPETAQVTRIENLFSQIPQEYQAIASRKCYGNDDHEFERKLTGYVLCREWEQHPADVASDLEALPISEQVAAEVERDSQWLDSDTERNDWDFTPAKNMPIIDFDEIDEIPL